ncbi:g2879 [Coccomyxa elongata]
MVTYHATFIPVPEHLLTRLCRALHTFIAANRPVIGGTQAPPFPGKEACFRAAKDGGIALLDIRSHISALQAKIPALLHIRSLAGTSRVHKYVESYQQLQPHRLIQPDSLSFHTTMSEPLFPNRQLRDADSLPLFWEDWPR